ncbi:ABC superfamily ATP binding cassette transporter, membrane domain protein [[Clostridium] sordellii ATCC 9714]|nr:ABC superfamily ATP binding cassette transporter, membrane domain protein [[Clostridium] sordellii ATCC 9714] [Paeniclostridium sordellii ATCC 9714]
MVGFIALWELLARLNIIDVFLFSKPSDIYNLFIKYIQMENCLSIY